MYFIAYFLQHMMLPVTFSSFNLDFLQHLKTKPQTQEMKQKKQKRRKRKPLNIQLYKSTYFILSIFDFNFLLTHLYKRIFFLGTLATYFYFLYNFSFFPLLSQTIPQKISCTLQQKCFKFFSFSFVVPVLQVYDSVCVSAFDFATV